MQNFNKYNFKALNFNKIKTYLRMWFCYLHVNYVLCRYYIFIINYNKY